MFNSNSMMVCINLKWTTCWRSRAQKPKFQNILADINKDDENHGFNAVLPEAPKIMSIQF